MLLSYKTRISTPQLKVTITHNLNIPDSEIHPSLRQSGLGSITQRTYSVRRPKDIDILPYSPQLSFLVLGSVDGKIVSPDKMCGSGIGRHLVECMRRNADFLGIHNISNIEIENMFPIISFTSSHPLSEIRSSPNLTFVSLKLKYAWITNTKGNTSGVRRTGVASNLQATSVENPVMSSRIGPFGNLLDQVACRLFSHHILPHYPLIFGPYSQFIRAEQALFPSISQSLRSIIKRSKNMQLKCQALASIEQIRTQNIFRMRMAREATRELDGSISTAYFDGDNEENEKNPLEEFTRIIALGLTSMFQRCIKPWTKGFNIKTRANIDQDVTTASDLSDIMDLSPNTAILWKYLEEDNLLPARQQGNGLWIEDQDEILDLDCNDSQDDSAKEDEDCFHNTQNSTEGILVPYFPLHSSPSDSDFVEERQLGFAPGEPSLDLDSDSEDGTMVCFVDESHDFLNLQTNFPSHELSPLRQPTDSLLLNDPEHSSHKLSHDHEVVLLKGQGLPENLDVCTHRDKASNYFFPLVNLDFGLEDVDSDMEVLDFDPPVIAENNIGDSFKSDYSLDLASQVLIKEGTI